MVRPRSKRPSRRDRAARTSGLDPRLHGIDIDPVKYPNLAAQVEMDRREHELRGRAAGLTRRQARQHADEHVLGSGE